MARDIDPNSRDILEFRPDIQRIEPNVMPGAITPILGPGTTLEKVEAEVDRVRKLAEAVNILAAATQARADLRAENMVIELDLLADSSTIAAMRRVYPTANPTKITYEQYKACKERQRIKGEDIGQQLLITIGEMNNSKDNLGGYGSADSKNGKLRPEVNPRAMIIPPINIMQVQDVLIKILVNFTWANIVKPTFITILSGSITGGPVAAAIEMIPDELIPLPDGFKVANITETGTPVLGEKPPKYLSELPPVPPVSIGAARDQEEKEKEQ